ncbi:MAG TPA: RNase adapter RapZ [Acidobacteriaceae bacterium]|nr:RNase adapter RapZ [Acidobacteriaceae bacterium]
MMVSNTKRSGKTPSSRSASKPVVKDASNRRAADNELVILTGLSGSGKLSALKAFEDLGYYAVDNLPIDLIQPFADLIRQSPGTRQAALVIDVREGTQLDRFPATLRRVRQMLPTKLVFLETSEDALLRRFSETRRPHPLGKTNTVLRSIKSERKLLEPLRNLADVLIDTTKFNVHELRAHINGLFQQEESERGLLISTISFGYKNGIPQEADLVFDVRFLPNPYFIPELRPLTGRDAKVVRYISRFPETKEFIERVRDLLMFLLPHYLQEGKSYLSVAFGCTGGQHRSVMVAERIKNLLEDAGYSVKSVHRDISH